jgi:hypothetical protein
VLVRVNFTFFNYLAIMANLRAPFIIAILGIIVLTGCKKDKQAGTTISMKTIAGKWEVTSYYFKSYHDDVYVSESTPADIDLEYEFTANGIIIVTEVGFAQTGTYSISRNGDKTVYFNAVAGRTGAADDGAGEIEVIDKNTIRLLFSRPIELDAQHSRNVFIEELHRK